MFNGARILVAPLDWGLGHAARCVPIVRALLQHGAKPVIGADKAPLALLREEFPQLEHVHLPGMEVRYAQGRSQALAMARQFPSMLRQVGKEHRMFQRMWRGHRLDAVISDQRFGLRSMDLPSVLITHQLHPFAPFAQEVARRINRWHIKHFDLCWVPDHADTPGLAGALSHGMERLASIRYIGPVSRFQQQMAGSAVPENRVVAVISGPEPQRTLLETALTEQLRRIEGTHLLITGKPGAASSQQGNIRTVGHLETDELSRVMKGAGSIIGRTGYSTLMDLDAIGRGALLIPTPGQPEQEYLGRLHGASGVHRVQEQHRLDIPTMLADPPPSFAPSQRSAAFLPALTELAHLIALRRSSIPRSV